MTLRALAALAGTIAALASPSPWPSFIVALLFVAALICIVNGRLAIALCCAAAAWTQLAILTQMRSMVREDGRMLVEARIDSLPVYSSQGSQFDVRIRLGVPGQPLILLRTHWRSAPAGAPRAGETWQLAMQL